MAYQHKQLSPCHVVSLDNISIQKLQQGAFNAEIQVWDFCFWDIVLYNYNYNCSFIQKLVARMWGKYFHQVKSPHLYIHSA